MSKEQKDIGVFGITYRLIPIMMRTMSSFIIICAAFDLALGLSWGIIPVTQQHFFESAGLLASGDLSFQEIWLPFIIMMMAYIANKLLDSLDNNVPKYLERIARGRLVQDLHRKMACLSAIDFEDISKLDDINKADNGLTAVGGFMRFISSVIFGHLPYFFFIYIFIL